MKELKMENERRGTGGRRADRRTSGREQADGNRRRGMGGIYFDRRAVIGFRSPRASLR